MIFSILADNNDNLYKNILYPHKQADTVARDCPDLRAVFAVIAQKCIKQFVHFLVIHFSGLRMPDSSTGFPIPASVSKVPLGLRYTSPSGVVRPLHRRFVGDDIPCKPGLFQTERSKSIPAYSCVPAVESEIFCSFELSVDYLRNFL